MAPRAEGEVERMRCVICRALLASAVYVRLHGTRVCVDCAREATALLAQQHGTGPAAVVPDTSAVKIDQRRR
jgi:hypothetical protein